MTDEELTEYVREALHEETMREIAALVKEREFRKGPEPDDERESNP